MSHTPSGFLPNVGSISHDACYNSPPAGPDARNTASHTLTLPSLVHGSDLVTLLNPILDASHTRNMKVSPPNSSCFPGTRLKVTKKIRSWMDSSLLFAKPHIMWVYGYAGCGKSAIAQEMARYFAGENRLAASFFFFRGAGDRSRVTRFATTVASQVAAAIPATAEMIERAVKANPGLLTTRNTSLADQFEHLVYRPINSVKWDKFAASLRHGPFLIVLDGVDECENREEVGVFIDRMIEFFDQKPRTPLRFLITSRVENHIHQRLHSSKQVRLVDLVKHTSNKDIMCALEAAIAKEKRGRLLACDKAWPSFEDKVKLVEHIGGSYIFMATILKRLFDPNGADSLSPMERLPVVLGMNPDFDNLYKAILEPWQHLPYFLDIISIVGLALEPLSIAQIGDILDIGTVAVAKVLLNLHAIIQIPGDDHTPVTLWHTSLRDFLCCPDRARHLVARKKYIAYGCLPLSAATLGGPPRSPATQYTTRFGKGHWTEFLESMDNNPSMLNIEFEGIVVCLHKTFSISPITEFHFWAFDTLLLHLAGVAKSAAKREGDLPSSTFPPLPSLTDSLKWTLLYTVLHPEEWQAFPAGRTHQVAHPSGLISCWRVRSVQIHLMAIK
ncbi:hypothetical protein FA13DRAFT_281017 [Coprinellus micaceus]|uniref:Nephrocystin 3-like N-terminal domain-containing protein n=1 Tax=Coprinellus micaceus TaxID=71717 RepID=A0A4Y7SEP6_COPMI|nr:hypothetical protein FA13DRAFT_281017 [Coprinellus micaceus]